LNFKPCIIDRSNNHHWGVPESFWCPKWKILCDVTTNKIDKSYLMVHSSRKDSFGFRGKIRINHILFCPTSSSHHKIKNVTDHHGNAKCPILCEHMALKGKNIDLSLNLFLTAALLNVLIQSNGSSSNLSVEKSDGFENWKQRRHDTRVPRGSLHNPLTESAWQRLFYSGIDQSLIAMTGFDHRSFHHLEDLFTPMFKQ
jgi:hypothetical protein